MREAATIRVPTHEIGGMHMHAVMILEASRPDGTVYRMQFGLGISVPGWLLRYVLP